MARFTALTSDTSDDDGEQPSSQAPDPHELDADESDNASSSGSSSSSPPPNARRRDASVIPWAQHVGVDAHKLHVMQASLFRAPEEATTLRELVEDKPSRKQLSLAPMKTVVRKHSRDSEGDGMRIVAEERASFAHDVDDVPFRPSRKYARVETASSLVKGAEDALVDAGLALGRSFRVGWGPSASLVHLGQLCGPTGNSKISANSSLILKTSLPFTHARKHASDLAQILLTHHLSRSPILPDEDGVPFANPSPDLSFASFASLFSSADHSFEALLFRLGHALFDDIQLHLHESVSVDVRNRIYAIRRKAALSSWLEEAVAPTVEAEVKRSMSASTAATTFTLLTGHQVEKACEASIAGGNVKLATLISQAGGDHTFVDDLRSQLQIWRDQRIDAHIDPDVRKVYALLAGVVDGLKGSNGTGTEQCADISIVQGLDWKRVFGLHLWFAQPIDAPIADVFDAYEQQWKTMAEQSAPPIPWYSESPLSGPSLWKTPSGATPPDALYNLIRLYADPACSLSAIFSPQSFGPSPLDFSLQWHIYILLSRCMGLRDLADRDDPGEDMSAGDSDDEPRIEGHSPSADLLASSFAHQLEQMDLIQEAAFVLLHIEGSAGREKAVKDLLARSAPKLDDWMTRGLAGSLKIPLSWVNEAKAIHELSNGNVYEAYQLYLQAGLYNAAHEIAVLELAPEAVIRDDMELLKSLFEKIAGHPVEGWHLRGKVYLDYVDVMTKVPELRTQVNDSDTVPDAAQAVELEELTRNIPKLLGILPDLLRNRSDSRHSAALAEMAANLTSELDKVQPLALSSTSSQLRTIPAYEATKLGHMQAAVYARFIRSFQVA
ncbi:nuclear protein 96-domain-containing protein [Amylostereum chailletii]|nr:nuclear protein 96-domain-containing protein [Amylostereum chailletii]